MIDLNPLPSQETRADTFDDDVDAFFGKLPKFAEELGKLPVVGVMESLGAEDGAGKVGNGGESVKDSLDALQLPDYAALRAYSGPRKSAYVTGVLGTAAPSGIAGMFVLDAADTTTADNGGTVIVAAGGKRFKRVFNGMPFIEWFGADRSGIKVSSAAAQAAYDAHGYVRAGDGVFLIDAPLVITKKGGFFCNKRGTTFKKTTTTANNITRSIVDVAGVSKTLTWNLPVVFDLVCPDNSYLIDFQVDGLSFDLPADASVGVFNAQRVAHSSFRNIYCDTSAFFVKGYDLWMVEWANIRSRDSKRHFDIAIGTSNSFRNVHCDRKHPSGGVAFFLTGLSYTTMDACGVDYNDIAYMIDGGSVTLTGCGAESHGRIIQALNGANVTISGGSLAAYKAAEATGTIYPYQFSGAGTKVAIRGAWLGVKNPADDGGTHSKMIVETGAQVSLSDARLPVEIGADGVWWIVQNSGSVLSVSDASGVMYHNYLGMSRRDGTSLRKTFEHTKTIPAGSAQSIFRIDNSLYGAICYGTIEVELFNSYIPDIGFAGQQTYKFSCFNETTQTQVLTKIGDAITRSNSGGTALGTVTAALVRNGDNTIDFQITIPAGFGPSDIGISAEYKAYRGGTPQSTTITGL